MICYIGHVMLVLLYNICDVMLYNIFIMSCHVMLYNTCYVCYITNVMLYNMCRVML